MAWGNVPQGVHPQNGDDGIIYDIDESGVSASGFGHPACGGNEIAEAARIEAGGARELAFQETPTDFVTRFGGNVMRIIGDEELSQGERKAALSRIL